MSDLTTKDALLERAVAALEKIKDGIDVINPVGVVQAFAGSTVPDGWLACDGSAVSRETYADLYAVIGDTYGDGDGSTTFNLPDLTDKFVQGNSTVGTVKSAGLPNISGDFDIKRSYSNSYPIVLNGTGVFKTTASGGSFEPLPAGSGTANSSVVQFDASWSDAIYGASETVQPPALTMQYIIKC